MNQISDLNQTLFERIAAIENDELSEEQLQREIAKTDAIVRVSDVILRNATLALKAQELFDQYGTGRSVDIPLLGISNDKLIQENKKLRSELKSHSGAL